MNKFNKFTKVATAFLICFIFIFNGCVTAGAVENTGQSQTKCVYLGGEAFGIKMFTKGAVIIRTEEFISGGICCCPAKESGVKVNDVVVKVNGGRIYNNEELEYEIESSQGERLDLTVDRAGKQLTISVTPKINEEGVYKIGAWIRDSCAGIGTISYYDCENGIYAALGHGVCDVDTGQLMPLREGSVVGASINGVTKGESGRIGTLNGFLDNNELGSVLLNCELGIYGQYNPDSINKEKVEIADPNKVTTGEAYIYSTVDSGGIKKYKAEILSFGDKSRNTNKNFVIKITDKDLLNVTGGIVQGMSGSPVVQNGKLAGVLNHVFVDDPQKGYCEFAQNMVSNFDDYHNIL